MRTRVTAGKTLKRAGATPLFRPRAAQKVIGVTPARFVQIMTNINRVYGVLPGPPGTRVAAGPGWGRLQSNYFLRSCDTNISPNAE